MRKKKIFGSSKRLAQEQKKFLFTAWLHVFFTALMEKILFPYIKRRWINFFFIRRNFEFFLPSSMTLEKKKLFFPSQPASQAKAGRKLRQRYFASFHVTVRKFFSPPHSRLVRPKRQKYEWSRIYFIFRYTIFAFPARKVTRFYYRKRTLYVQNSFS